MIIGLAGYAQSGKDTVATFLVEHYGFRRIAFADTIRNFIYDINPMVFTEPLQVKVDVEGWEKAKQNGEVRRLLQKTGVAARNLFGENFWIEQAFRTVLDEERIVVTDVRFKNEAEYIQSYEYSQVWRVTRPGVGPVNNHVSESEMENYPYDKVINNDGDYKDLALEIYKAMNPL